MKTVIRAEMVANVWRVVAGVGEQVSADDPIVILESMKMEIPVAAEDDCQVTQIFVTEGAVVQEGDPIAEVETSR
jgi:acetyl-CoA carboxylase biotin carboxyl carrier protein